MTKKKSLKISTRDREALHNTIRKYGKKLTCAELNDFGCDEPDCTHDHTIIYIHPRCHPDSGVWASFDKSTGAMTIECKECQMPLANILVAGGSKAALDAKTDDETAPHIH